MRAPDQPASTVPGILVAVDAVALESLDGRPATYRDVLIGANGVGAALRRHGVRRTDRVVIVAPNSPGFVTTFLGACTAGTCAPLNPAYSRTEFEFYFDDLEPRAVIIDSSLDTPARALAGERGISVIELGSGRDGTSGAVTFDGASPAGTPDEFPAADDIALILHTSGTTSRPKMVPLTHANLAASASHIATTLNLTARDRSLVVMPLFHIHGLVAGVLAPLSAGGAVIVPPGFQAPEFASWIERFRPTWYTAVPTMHQAILQRIADKPVDESAATLRFVRSSSAALAPALIREIESRLGVPVIEAYGMTEASHQMASNPLPPGSRKPGTVGKAAGPEIALMDEAGTLVDAGQTGEVVIRGANVTRGYLANDAANVAAFTNGWFRTGDQGHLDRDGYLTLTGRLKELINRAGEKVAPLEVDAALAEHPAVAQAICFGIPHPILGEDVAAAVVLRAGSDVTPRALRDFVAARLAYYKVPRQVRIVERIPVGATGKLQRRGLGDLLGVIAEVPVVSGDTTAARTPVEEIVQAAWREVLRCEVPGVHENFFAIGGDSMLATRVVSRLRDLLQVELPLISFFDSPTVAATAAELDLLLAAET